jgi:hypothetical protein
MARSKKQIIDFYAGVAYEVAELTSSQFEALRMALAYACSEIEDNCTPAFTELHDQLADAKNENVRLMGLVIDREAEIAGLQADLRASKGKKPQPSLAAFMIHENAKLHPATITPNGTLAAPVDADPAAEPNPTPAPPAAAEPLPRQPFTWSLLEDGRRAIVEALEEGRAWRTVEPRDQHSIVLSVIAELQSRQPEGLALTIEQFNARRPQWMPMFPTLSSQLSLTWVQMRQIAASPQTWPANALRELQLGED